MFYVRGIGNICNFQCDSCGREEGCPDGRADIAPPMVCGACQRSGIDAVAIDDETYIVDGLDPADFVGETPTDGGIELRMRHDGTTSVAIVVYGPEMERHPEMDQAIGSPSLNARIGMDIAYAIIYD